MGGRGRTLDALQAALAGEHVTVYGYGVVGSRLPGASRGTAMTIWDDHRAARDRLAELIIARSARPVAAAASYRLPVKVTSVRAAGELAAELEDAMLRAYIPLTGAGDPRLRRFAGAAMQEAMTRAIRWRAMFAGSAPAGEGPPPGGISSAAGPAAAFPGIDPGALRPLPGQ